ncbi:Abi family protein [Skermania piniformis]
MVVWIDPLPSLSTMLKWEGPFIGGLRCLLKPSLSWNEQVDLLVRRGLAIGDRAACARFLAANNYYRFSGYMRYFQNAPHLGDNSFRPQTAFDDIYAVYQADEGLRSLLYQRLARAEILLRTHTAYVIANDDGPCGRYLEKDFYTEAANSTSTAESCLADIARSKERHILRYMSAGHEAADLPVWSAVEAFSFGTLSKCIERGGQGSLSDAVATSVGVAKAGFPYRVRALVYLRNRCAHHCRLWHHSVIDAGPTPNNVRVKAKKLAGQFEPRSVLDVVASLDDILVRGSAADPVLPQLVQQHERTSAFWQGLAKPVSPRDCGA